MCMHSATSRRSSFSGACGGRSAGRFTVPMTPGASVSSAKASNVRSVRRVHPDRPSSFKFWHDVTTWTIPAPLMLSQPLTSRHCKVTDVCSAITAMESLSIAGDPSSVSRTRRGQANTTCRTGTTFIQEQYLAESASSRGNPDVTLKYSDLSSACLSDVVPVLVECCEKTPDTPSCVSTELV